MTDARQEPTLTFTQNPKGPNELLVREGFSISYHRNPGGGVGFFAGDDGSDETALYVAGPDGARGKYFILNGDHRAEYAIAAASGVSACLAVYESRRAVQRSSWSEDSDAEDALEWFARRFAALSHETDGGNQT